MRSLALLLLLLTGCQDVALQPQVSDDPWPQPRTFEVTYSADSIHYALRWFADPTKRIGREPGEWWCMGAVVSSADPGFNVEVQVYPDHADVILPEYQEDGGFPVLGSVPLHDTPTSLRFSFPRSWTTDPGAAPTMATCVIQGRNPDGSEYVGHILNATPRRRDGPLLTAQTPLQIRR